jgi:hypothetical protein
LSIKNYNAGIIEEKCSKLENQGKQANLDTSHHNRHTNDDPSGSNERSSEDPCPFRPDGNYRRLPRRIFLVLVRKVLFGMARTEKGYGEQKTSEYSEKKAD